MVKCDWPWRLPLSYGCYGAIRLATKHATINLYYMQWGCIVKTRKTINYYYYYDYFCVFRHWQCATATRQQQNNGPCSAHLTNSTSLTPQGRSQQYFQRGLAGGGRGGCGHVIILCQPRVVLKLLVFFSEVMCMRVHVISWQKNMVHPPCKYLCRLIQTVIIRQLFGKRITAKFVISCFSFILGC